MSDKTAKLYRLSESPLEKVLPQLLGKAYEQGLKAVVLAADAAQAEALNQALWTFNPASFLPHGSSKEPYPDRQPIYLTAAEENPNGADMLVLAGTDAEAGFIGSFRHCVELWDGVGESELPFSRRVARYQPLGFAVKAWQQDAKGAWVPLAA